MLKCKNRELPPKQQGGSGSDLLQHAACEASWGRPAGRLYKYKLAFVGQNAKRRGTTPLAPCKRQLEQSKGHNNIHDTTCRLGLFLFNPDLLWVPVLHLLPQTFPVDSSIFIHIFSCQCTTCMFWFGYFLIVMLIDVRSKMSWNSQFFLYIICILKWPSEWILTIW